MAEEQPAQPWRIIPPMVFLAAIIIMIGLYRFAPGPEIIAAPWNRLGWALLAAGIAVAVIIKRRFDAVETTIRPFEEPTALVTDGLFRFSRNPIYAAMAVGLMGIAAVLGTATPFLVVPVFAWIIQSRFIAMEEAKLEQAFGDAYRDYKARVRRWF